MDKIKEKIQLSNGYMYDIEEIFSFDNIITIVFPSEIDIKNIISDMSNFKKIVILTRSGLPCGSYENFDTIYKLSGQTLILSNDGSIYVELANPPDVEITNPISTLEDVKNRKIIDLSYQCEQSIYDGVTINVDGVKEKFSYKEVDQMNIKNAYELAIQTKLDIPYHSDNNGCKLYTFEQISQLYVKQQINLTHHTTYFNQLKMYILNEINNKDDVLKITYGDPLTGEYLNNYNTMMQQTLLITQKLKEGLAV